MLVAHDRKTYVPDQRFVPFDECRERELSDFAGIGGEAFQKLAVGEVADGADVVEGLDLAQQGAGASSEYHGESSVASEPFVLLAESVSLVSI